MKSIFNSWLWFSVMNFFRELFRKSSEIKATPEERRCHFEYLTEQIIEACIDKCYWQYCDEVPSFNALLEMVDEVLGFYPETGTGKNIYESMMDNLDLEFIHEQVSMVVENRLKLRR